MPFQEEGKTAIGFTGDYRLSDFLVASGVSIASALAVVPMRRAVRDSIPRFERPRRLNPPAVIPCGKLAGDLRVPCSLRSFLATPTSAATMD